MDGIELAVQSIEALGFEHTLHRDNGTISFTKIFQPDLTIEGYFGSYHVLGGYDSNSGQYSLHLGMAANSPLAQNINDRVIREVGNPNGEQLRKQLSDIGQGVLDEVKEELGMPTDIRIGGIALSVSYFVDIVLNGTNLGELYEELKPFADKLGYTI